MTGEKNSDIFVSFFKGGCHNFQYFTISSVGIEIGGKMFKNDFFYFKKSHKILFNLFKDWTFSPFWCPQQPNFTPYQCSRQPNFTPFWCPWQLNFTPLRCPRQLLNEYEYPLSHAWATRAVVEDTKTEKIWLTGTPKRNKFWLLGTPKWGKIWLSGTPKWSQISILKKI